MRAQVSNPPRVQLAETGEHAAVFCFRVGAGARVLPVRARRVRCEAVVGADAPRSWIHCAVAGTYEGHPAGAFTFDAGVFAELIQNFARRETPVPLTYEHPGYWGDGMPVPAAGFVHELAARDGGLFALVEWTPAGAQYVRAGEYRYCSVVVGEAVDQKSGEPIGLRLFEIGLTNQPFIDGLQPITLPDATAA